jgi:hypothetical protein
VTGFQEVGQIRNGKSASLHKLSGMSNQIDMTNPINRIGGTRRLPTVGHHTAVGRVLIVAGLLLVGIGLPLPLGGRLPISFGLPPGDIMAAGTFSSVSDLLAFERAPDPTRLPVQPPLVRAANRRMTRRKTRVMDTEPEGRIEDFRLDRKRFPWFA